MQTGNYTNNHRFTIKIIIGMLFGIVVGLAIKWIPFAEATRGFLINNIFELFGQIFLNLIKLLVIPIVLVSLVYGMASLGNLKKLGRVGGKSLLLYIITTGIAVVLGLLLASLFHVGRGLSLPKPVEFVMQPPPALTSILTNIFPQNPFKALAQGNMLQVIVFALLLGIAIAASGEKGKRVGKAFGALNEVLLKLVMMIMRLAPYGVFFLLAALFARVGFRVIGHLLGYFFVVLLVLAMQLIATYSTILVVIGRLSPLPFYRKMYAAMLFAFSISSSNASIPVVLRTVEFRLGVKNSVASFVIPLGATINMDGTAIMQGVATVFIAHAYNLNMGWGGYFIVIGMATLASIGTAGVPGVGLITLAMVLQQVGLPVAGIALIIGVDRLLDMTRTAVNIAGDSMIACIVGKSEKAFNLKRYNNLKL